VQIDTFPWRSLWQISGGIGASVTISVVARLLPLPLRITHRSGLRITIWRVARPYLGSAALSLFIAVVILASSEMGSIAWYDAVLVGYAADSTMQKLIRR
jgi:hypothetical protein